LLTAPYVLFRDDTTGLVTMFTDPVEMIVAHETDEFFPALARMQAARLEGKYLVGYMSYEAGYLFEKKLAPLAGKHRDVPLLCFGVFTSPSGDAERYAPGELVDADDFLSDVRPGWTREDYRVHFSKLHEHLRKGDCYQANLTMPIDARWHGDPLTAFWSLIERQPVRYGTLVSLGGPVILSRSPELFFSVKDGWIETHPMKGTVRRGGSPAQDAVLISNMLKDEKTLAENRMIVDLLRNDISRITEVGTLDVPKLFEIETYPTVHQMVSHVRAKLLPGLIIEDIFAALFPCGSITGAPKMRAMEILNDLEIGPRNVYCGAIGMISPDGDMRFSVAIRTITMFDDGRATFNVGGGIVFDSTADAEYEECLLKAKFVTGEKRLG
jgi:para-aminobenzoate synthetase component 1